MNELMRVENLSKSFWLEKKEIPVLRNINFKIRRGEMTSIVGASGAGKSTLLHILGALDQPTEGEVFFEGESLFKKNDRQLAQFRNKKIGFVFQFHHLLPEFSALENVMMPFLISGGSKKEGAALARERLDEMGLSKRLQHKPGELSGGEQQRVAIARALILKPAILLADELTGNLDTQTGEEILSHLLALNETHHMTMIIVTHNDALAQHLPIHYRMVDGRLSPEEV